jgi:alpha-tubulin suppressor-like RCC1 family protein
MAIRSNGTSWGWGYNGQGNIGDGTTIYRSSPSSVVGAVTSWVQISAYNNSAAIRGST